jgi:hypothetical protein
MKVETTEKTKVQNGTDTEVENTEETEVQIVTGTEVGKTSTGVFPVHAANVFGNSTVEFVLATKT